MPATDGTVQPEFTTVREASRHGLAKVNPLLLNFIVMFFGSGIYAIGPLLAIVLARVLPRRASALLAAAYAVRVATDTSSKTGRASWSWMRSQRLFCQCFEYLPLALRVGADVHLDPQKKYVVGLHPHGIFPASMAYLCCQQSAWYERFPGIKFFITGATVVFQVPWVREVAMAFGAVDARREVLEGMLKAGHSVGIAIGGEAEALESESGRDALVLNSRQGFVRLALAQGADLVPTYAFGLNDIFTTKASWGRGLRQWLCKHLHVALPIFWGRGFTPLPHRRPVTVVVGKPIRVPAPPASRATATATAGQGGTTGGEQEQEQDGGDGGHSAAPCTPEAGGYAPDQALVTHFHALYVQAVQELYDAHKADLGFGDRELELL
jgi:hypothetical protein